MKGEKQSRGGRPNVPVYGRSGIYPAYFSGSAVKSDIPYSRAAKIAGFLVALAMILLVAWFLLKIIRGTL